VCSRKKPCGENSDCKVTGPGTWKCLCKPGYKGKTKCEAIDACGSNPCHKKATCKNTGPGTHMCTCRNGYRGNGLECEKIKACKSNPCGDGAKCLNTAPGKYKCRCRRGFKPIGPGAKGCVAIDACEKNPCDKNATCEAYAPGKFRCKCKRFFRGNGLKCREVHPCRAGRNPCDPVNAICKKVGLGQASCKCRKGFRGDGKSCMPIDACSTQPCAKDASCTATGPGSYRCACNKGFKGDGKLACVEINPCAAKPCHPDAWCKKTSPGQFTCKCKKGFRGDGTYCHQTGTVVTFIKGPNGIDIPIVKPAPAPTGAAPSSLGTAPIASAKPIDNYGAAVSEVLRVVTEKMDTGAMREQNRKQKQQERVISKVNDRLASLEKSTRELIESTSEQTETLKSLLGAPVDAGAPPKQPVVPPLAASIDEAGLPLPPLRHSIESHASLVQAPPAPLPPAPAVADLKARLQNTAPK